MASAAIDLSISRTGKLSRARMFTRLFLVIVALAVLLAMSFLPDPTRGNGRGQEARKSGAPTVSRPEKPGVGSNSVTSKALHSV
jgi:hypothetical protein